MTSGGIATSGVIELVSDTLEGGGLINRNGTGPVLVFHVWVLYGRTECRKAVGLARTVGGLWLWSGQVVWPGEGRAGLRLWVY